MNEEELKELEQCGAAWLSPADTAIVMGLDLLEFTELMEANGPEHLAYMRARLKRTVAYRNSILDLAVAGSAPAQELALKLYKQHVIDNTDL